MKVALYCRVSTEEQARTGESILDQRQALERWARENGHEIVGVFEDDGFSAHKSYRSRPHLAQLLDAVRAGTVELIAFTKFDRWTRRAADYYELQEILDRHRVPWTAILEDYETVTADGRFKVGIMLSVNQHEAERTSERIKFTFEQKRLRGEIISGNMPKGYMLVDKKPVKDPAAAPGIDAFWRTYLSGAGMKPALLAAESHGVHLATSSGSFILRNAKAYTGQIQGVSCDPYITAEEAERVLTTRKTKAKASGCVYYFRGLIFCSECGGAMSAHRNTYRRKDGKGMQIFYNCMKRYRTLGRECINCTNIYEADIERALLHDLSGAIEAEAQRMEAQIAAYRERRQDPQIFERARQRLETRRKRAWDAYLGGVIELQAYQEEKDQIDAELAKLTPSADPEPDVTAPQRLRSALPEGWEEMYKRLDRPHKHQFWAQMVEHIEITPEREVLFLVKVPTIQERKPDGYWLEIVPEKKN